MNNFTFTFKALFIATVVSYVSACADRSIVNFDDSVVQVNDLNDFDTDGVIEQRDLCDGTTLGSLIDNDGCGEYNTYTEPYLLDIHFSNDSYVVPSNAYDNIEALANILKEQTGVNIVVEGHCSKVGTAEYNNVLSTHRAEAVADVLVSHFNVEKHRVSTVGYGYERLIDFNYNEEAHSKNRRIAIEFSYTKKERNKKWTIYSVDETK